MSDPRFFVYTAIVCTHCGSHIFGQHTLRDTVSRGALVRGAKRNRAVRSGFDWFCNTKCRTEHQMAPGIPKATRYGMPKT